MSTRRTPAKHPLGNEEVAVDPLIHQRSQAKGKVTRIYNVLEQATADATLLTLPKVRMFEKKLETAYNEFQFHHQQIMAVIPPARREEHDGRYIQFEELHDEVATLLENWIEVLSKPAPTTHLVPAPAVQQPLVIQQPLPRAIPSFDGKYAQWEKFKIMFKDVVDRSQEPPRIKLYHLEKALVGDAAGLIDAKTISDGNYDRAWEILEERFEDKRRMVDLHISALLGVKKLAKESHAGLRALVETFSSNVENLKFLGQEFNGVSEPMVVHLIAHALDDETRRLWEATVKKGELPTYDATMAFLKERVSVLERCRGSTDSSARAPSKIVPSKPLQKVNAATSSTPYEIRCDFCSSNHPTFKCPEYSSLSVADRLAKVKSIDCCFNCLRRGHRVGSCPSKKTCGKCQRKHHTSLHYSDGAQSSKKPEAEGKKPDAPPTPVPAQGSAQEESAKKQPSVSAHSNSNPSQPANKVVLLTALVDVLDRNRQPHVCRALLDNGSEVSFISSSFANAINLPVEEVSVSITGIGCTQSVIKHKSLVYARSRASDYSFSVNCLVSPNITSNVPTVSFDIDSWNLPSGIQLADPSFHESSPIDMLIGMDLFYELMKSSYLKVSDNLPGLHDSHLGWLVGGKISSSPMTYSVKVHTAVSVPIDQLLQKFWEVESVTPDSVPTNEEEECEKQFLATYRRNAEGRFVVQLPLKDTVSSLVSSRSLALRRFFVLESKLSRQPELKVQYDAFMDEYESLGHCKEICEADDSPEILKWYLPHHAVLRPSNTSTKCRVVFDGSAKIAESPLNDVMMVGPTVQRDLLSIILSFCKYQYVLSADIAKMYRQILVSPLHTPLQRIFWRKSPSEKLRVLELTTVTYGTAAAPFLATRALLQLAHEERERFPLAAKVIEENVYVDDALFGSDSFEEALEIQSQLVCLLKSAGMELHKWSSNEELLLLPIPDVHRDSLVAVGECGVNEVIKTLGLMWNPSTDEFMFVTVPPASTDIPTKRQCLSVIAKVFDPIGFISPVIVIGKMLMQKLWISKLEWDDKLDDKLHLQWKEFLRSLPTENQIRIPRLIMLPNADCFELHGFADASQLAYGACVYVRSIFSDDTAKMRLVTSKSKVCPTSPLSIPRKELLAALLLTRLVKKVLAAIGNSFASIVLWSDSQVVLAWLKKSSPQLQVYVRNRVAEIIKETYQWRYVPTAVNPADTVSRGQSASDLVKNDIWWNGPPFLRTSIYEVERPQELSDSDIPELRSENPVSCLAMSYNELTINSVPLLAKYESFRKTQRVVAYVLRFTANCRKKPEDRVKSTYPTVPELRSAMLMIVGSIQAEEFAAEIKCIRSDDPNHRLNNLKPFMDGDVLRVGGRIRHSDLPYETKHQLILPNKNPLVRRLIIAIHRENLHVGPSAVMSILRQQFWLLNARSTVRQIIRSCITCFKQRPSTIGQQMGDLPEYRVKDAPAFLRVGIDFAGPILLKQKNRKAGPIKGYICVYVCMVSKAIHLEAVEDLSAESFLGSFQRFVSRRGVPEEVYSDNGTNFIGAKSELHELYVLFQNESTSKQIFEYCQPKEIKWHTIPPNAPHFGGLWEAGVKSVKSVLKKVYHSASLTISEFETLLCQIEALLNSRPLYANSDDPDDLEVLTPGHLMIGRPLVAIPEPSYEAIPSNRLSRWQYVQQLREHFWKRWRKEYLTELQVRGKWTKKSPNVRPGTIVLIKEDNVPPQSWRMGRIIKVYFGSDKLVRVVDIKTKSNVISRPIHKLAPLPIIDNLTSSPAEDVQSEA